MQHAQYLRQGYQSALDGLRAVVALLVITSHMHIGDWHWLGGNKHVTLFFILSGYLLTCLALREERQRGRFHIRAFYLRRMFRIFPLYYLILALYFLLIVVADVRPDKTHKFLQALPFDLFYLQEIPFYYGVDGDHFNIALYHTWSLGIEEKFYLLWPLIFFAMLGWQHRQRAITLLRLPVALLLLALFANARHLGPALGGALFPYFHLLLGCAAALLLNNPRVYAALHWLRKQWLAGGITTVFVVAQVAWPNHENWPYYYPQDMLYSLISVLFVMVLSTIPEGRIAKLMSARPLVALGKLSYPIFLIHILAINAAEKIIQTLQPAASGLVWGLLTYGLVLLLTIPVAYVLNRTIGQPLMDIGRRVSARMIQAAAPATTPARLS